MVIFADPEHPQGHFDQRGFIMLPGEEHRVNFIPDNDQALDLKKVKIHTLNALWHNHGKIK